MNKLILASGSKNRQEALDIARIPFTAIPSEIDESAIIDSDIRERVVKIAQAKVAAVAKTHGGVILGADGVNMVDDTVLEKPKDREEAVSMLRMQSGNRCSFLSGWCVVNTETGKEYSGLTESYYQFRELSQNEIEVYIETENVYQFAAAFSPINTMAIRFVAWMEGSPSQFNFSLPFDKIIPILQKEGIV